MGSILIYFLKFSTFTISPVKDASSAIGLLPPKQTTSTHRDSFFHQTTTTITSNPHDEYTLAFSSTHPVPDTQYSSQPDRSNPHFKRDEILPQIAETNLSPSAPPPSINPLFLDKEILQRILLNEPGSVAFADYRLPWKRNIVTTVFWIGEKATKRNPIANIKSSWDYQWQSHFGGYDNPNLEARSDYHPANFIPKQNPFYVALPYNDITSKGTKAEAPFIIPWFKNSSTIPGHSVCKGRWIAIRHENQTCYAQWEDVGPFLTDHWQYVFGNEKPRPNLNHGAGLDVSPAVRDYLKLKDKDLTDWQFVDVSDVPKGPWMQYGENNIFAIALNKKELASAK